MFSHEYYKTGSKRGNDKKGKEYLKLVLIAVLVTLFLRIFIFEAFRIPTTSMIPTLKSKDHVLVNKFIYGVKLPIFNIKLPGFSKPKQGDIIVFQSPQYKTKNFLIQFIDLVTFGIFDLDGSKDNPKNYIKRTIGVPGDFINISTEEVVINDRSQNSSSLKLQQIKINDKKLIRNFISKIDYKSPFGEAKADLYVENSLNRKYNVQYIDNGISITGDFYIPKNGDVITVRWIKPETRTQDSADQTTSQPNVPTVNTQPDNPLISRDGFNPDRNFITTGQVEIIVNNNKKIIINANTFDTIYNNLTNRILPKELIRSILLEKTVKFAFKTSYYFVIGDNRDASEDSRTWGLVNEDLIVGAPFMIYYPLSRFGGIK